MAWTVIASPGLVTKQPGIQRIEVGRLDEQLTIWREKVVRLLQDGPRVGHMLYQVEHKDHIETLLRLKLFEAAEEVFMPGQPG